MTNVSPRGGNDVAAAVAPDGDPAGFADAAQGTIKDAWRSAGTKGFKLLPPRNDKAKVPRAADVGKPMLCHMGLLPQPVRDRLGSPTIVVGFDTETHDWLNDLPRKGSIGPYGWYRIRDELSTEYARIIQLGWACGSVDEGATVQTKRRFIKPTGFQVSTKATAFHHLTQELLEQEGLELKTVLDEFLTDVRYACQHGGRVVAHHLEFDAGVIDCELNRCGLTELREEWRCFARNGFCTMNPELGRWVRIASGREVGAPTAKHCEGLAATLQLLLPDKAMLLSGHHDAGRDAELTRSIYVALLRKSGTAAT